MHLKLSRPRLLTARSWTSSWASPGSLVDVQNLPLNRISKWFKFLHSSVRIQKSQVIQFIPKAKNFESFFPAFPTAELRLTPKSMGKKRSPHPWIQGTNIQRSYSKSPRTRQLLEEKETKWYFL